MKPPMHCNVCGDTKCTSEGGSVKIEITQSELSDLVLYAQRYCASRISYASEDGASLVARFASVILPSTRHVIIRDLQEWESSGNECYWGGCREMPGSWKSALRKLEVQP